MGITLFCLVALRKRGAIFFSIFFALGVAYIYFCCILAPSNKQKQSTMKKQEYINQIIKNNLNMGYSLEQIMQDIKSAMQRSLKYELETLDAVQELCETEHGYAQMKRLTNA